MTRKPLKTKRFQGLAFRLNGARGGICGTWSPPLKIAHSGAIPIPSSACPPILPSPANRYRVPFTTDYRMFDIFKSGRWYFACGNTPGLRNTLTLVPSAIRRTPSKAYIRSKVARMTAAIPQRTGIRFLRTSSSGLTLQIAATGMTAQGITVPPPIQIVRSCPIPAKTSL